MDLVFFLSGAFVFAMGTSFGVAMTRNKIDVSKLGDDTWDPPSV